MNTKHKGVKKRDFISLPVGILIVIILIYMLYINLHGIIPNSLWVSTTEKLDSDLVCMVNNMYMGKKQIEIEINEKAYYGCCEMCKITLTTDSTSRFAKDPYTGETVDKAVAYIVLRSKRSDLVHYFKSKENFEKYIQNADLKSGKDETR